MDQLCNYTWPGNVRQLRNAIERACTLGRGELVQASDLPLDVLERTVVGTHDEPVDGELAVDGTGETFQEMKKITSQFVKLFF